MSAQRLEKWLKAAPDEAAKDWTVNFHFTYSRRAFDLSGRRGADKADFYSPNW